MQIPHCMMQSYIILVQFNFDQSENRIWRTGLHTWFSFKHYTVLRAKSAYLKYWVISDDVNCSWVRAGFGQAARQQQVQWWANTLCLIGVQVKVWRIGWHTVQPKPLFWFRYKTKTQIGQYFLADAVTNNKPTFQRENLVKNSTGFVSIIKVHLKPNLPTNIEFL